MDGSMNFYSWCEIVCGRFRLASEETLKNLWEKDYLPQQAIEYLERTRQFRKRYRNLVPFWEAWKGPPIPVVRRRRTISHFELQCRIAQAIMEAIRKARDNRLEPETLAFANRLYEQCKATLQERERRKQERYAKKKP